MWLGGCSLEHGRELQLVRNAKDDQSLVTLDERSCDFHWCHLWLGGGQVVVAEPMTLPAVQKEAWDLTGTGLRIKDPNLSYEAFENLCVYVAEQWATVSEAAWALKFAVGDLCLQGEHLYGDSVYQALEHLGLSEEVKRECVRVSSRVPYSRRRKGVSWSHHRAVAPLEPAEQKQMLQRAVDEGMSHHSLRAALRNGREPEVVESCPTCGKRL